MSTSSSDREPESGQRGPLGPAASRPADAGSGERASGSPQPDSGRAKARPVPRATRVGEAVLSGGLLLAMPSLTDPNFAHTVIFLVQHNESGTVGVVLNRPSEVELGRVLPEWAEWSEQQAYFQVGGPCEQDAALGLARGDDLYVAARSSTVMLDHLAELGIRLTGMRGVFLVNLDDRPQLPTDALTDVRVFAGYAGWAAGQLEAEIAAGAWLCVPGSAQEIFAADPTAVRRLILDRQVGPLAFLRAMPDKISAN